MSMKKPLIVPMFLLALLFATGCGQALSSDGQMVLAYLQDAQRMHMQDGVTVDYCDYVQRQGVSYVAADISDKDRFKGVDLADLKAGVGAFASWCQEGAN